MKHIISFSEDDIKRLIVEELFRRKLILPPSNREATFDDEFKFITLGYDDREIFSAEYTREQ